ncbi:transposable element Tcb1 transposase [Trichonephila clavipes]|nr:transposable element Tcb1 transposase [Trichonephila clavipes]
MKRRPLFLHLYICSDTESREEKTRHGGGFKWIKLEKHKTTSGCFYARSNHWEEVGGRPQCDKCGCRVRNCSQPRFTTLETISNYSNSYPGFSSGRPRGTTPADDRYIVLQARRNRRQTAEKSQDTRHRRLDDRYRVLPWPEDCTVVVGLHDALHGVYLFLPAHRRRRSLWCREHRNWRDNEWGRVLLTDESRFSLSSDSHRILIWRERGSRNHPSNIIERDKYGGRGVLVWEASCMVVAQTSTSSTQVQSTGPVIVTRFFFHICVF